MLGSCFQKRLRMERLEEKVPLAGDVTVALIDGDLVITGDAQSNLIAIEEGSLDGHQYRLYARGGETINGLPFEDVYYIDGVTRDVIVDLGGGADSFRAHGTGGAPGFEVPIAVPRDLRITMSAGEDTISLGVTEDEEFFFDFSFPQSPVSVGRDLIVSSGGDADNYFLSATQVGRNFTISDSGGDTYLEVFPSHLYPVSVLPMEVDGNFTVTTGTGTDLLYIEEINVGGNVTYSLGGGDDYAQLAGFSAGGSILVNAGAGANEVRIEGGSVAGGILMTGSGANNFQVTGVDVTSSIVMLGSNGDDQLYILSSTASSAIITAGGGADYVQLTDSAFDLLMVSLGAGSDTLSLDTVQATLAVLIGGGGSDTLQEAADNSFLIALDLGFEIFEAI